MITIINYDYNYSLIIYEIIYWEINYNYTFNLNILDYITIIDYMKLYIEKLIII